MPRILILIFAAIFSHGALAQEQDMQQRITIPSGVGSLRLFLRHQAPAKLSAGAPVLIIHGATFPSGNAAGWKIAGRSWMDELVAAGFDVYALDFLGYGESDRYPEMASEDANGPTLGGIDTMTEQVDRAVQYILKMHGGERVNLVAHSAGTLVAGRYAQLHAERVARLVLFGAPAPHKTNADNGRASVRYFQVSAQDQLAAFETNVRQANRLDMDMFQQWAETYLSGDPQSGLRHPASVRVPAGMIAAIEEMSRSGQLPYDPAQIERPGLIIQGNWDAVSPPSDGAWIFERLSAPLKRLVVLSQGGHRLHLEASRFQLYREVEAFLAGNDGVG